MQLQYAPATGEHRAEVGYMSKDNARDWATAFEITLERYMREMQDQLAQGKTAELEPDSKGRIVAMSSYLPVLHDLVVHAQTAIRMRAEGVGDYERYYHAASSRHNLSTRDPQLYRRWAGMLSYRLT